MTENKVFNDKIEKLFENKLGYNETTFIVVRDLVNNKILNVDYSLLRFDSNLNIYKKVAENIDVFAPVNNPNFKAEIIRKEIYKKLD